MKKQQVPEQIARLFKSLSQPARIQILLAIGSGEACVCHLEAILQMRQAYISQHLMALREDGILTARREGRFIFYQLKSPEIMEFIRIAGEMADIPGDWVVFATGEQPYPGCCCPHCMPSPETDLIDFRQVEASS